jgi:hypothetical protein
MDDAVRGAVGLGDPGLVACGSVRTMSLPSFAAESLATDRHEHRFAFGIIDGLGDTARAPCRAGCDRSGSGDPSALIGVGGV